jgi:hypothetical protein
VCRLHKDLVVYCLEIHQGELESPVVDHFDAKLDSIFVDDQVAIEL